jgi:hypothetical protein
MVMAKKCAHVTCLIYQFAGSLNLGEPGSPDYTNLVQLILVHEFLFILNPYFYNKAPVTQN